jgi:hypothetical protein
MAGVEDDGRDELTVVLKMDGEEFELILRDEAEQRAVALEGWTAFVPATSAILED